MELTNTERGIPSGFPSLDKTTGGWQNSNLIVIASRPSVGKTTFALNIARNAATEYNIPVAFFSLEMSSAQLSRRLIIQETGLSKEGETGFRDIYTTEWQQLEGKLEKLSKAPLYIDDTPGLSVKDFREKVKELVEEKNVRLVVIDYLQLMSGPEEFRGQREKELTFIIRSLKSAAKEFALPIIAFSQLSRVASACPDGSTEKPTIHKFLYGSEVVEELADTIILIHRPWCRHLDASLEEQSKGLLMIEKSSKGDSREIPIVLNPFRVSFEEPSEII